MTMTSALPEIAESDASGQIAEIYEDIRHSLKLSNVNLIYRYFATIEGALPWAWDILKPHFSSGEIQVYARQSLGLYAINFQLQEDLPNLSVSATQRSKLTQILDFYLEANPMNLFALQILNNNLAPSRGDRASQITPLTTALALQEAARSARFSSVARELMFYVSQGAEQIRPTLLRQLAEWPHVINSIAGFTKTICCDPNFARQTSGIRDYSLSKLNNLARDGKTTGLKARPLQELTEFCNYFPSPLIRMTIIANHLRSSL